MVIFPVMYKDTVAFRAPLAFLQTLRVYYIFYRRSKRVLFKTSMHYLY